MPKNKVSDPITDQEIAFARLVLSGAMTDRHAAEAVGLNPDSAAYTKSKPRVRAYMLEHRAAVQQQLVQQEAEGLHRLNLDREQVLARLWEIANLSPGMTRGSITGQVKALSMIVAMQNFIPDRLAASSEKKSAPATTQPQIYAAAWRARQQTTTTDLQPSPAPAQEEDSPARPGVSWKPEPAPGSAEEAPPDPGQSTFTKSSEAPPPPPYVPALTSVPDTGVGFSIKKNPFGPAELRIPKTTPKYFGNRIDHEQATTAMLSRTQLFGPAVRHKLKIELCLRSFVKRPCCPDPRFAVLLLTRQLAIATHRESADSCVPLLFGKA
jgi:hypothetical protein